MIEGLLCKILASNIAKRKAEKPGAFCPPAGLPGGSRTPTGDREMLKIRHLSKD